METIKSESNSLQIYESIMDYLTHMDYLIHMDYLTKSIRSDEQIFAALVMHFNRKFYS